MATLDQLHFVLTLLAALGCGLMAGVFFAFSTFVMKALARLAPASGIAAMQSINVTVINPMFMAVFLGTAGISLILLISCVVSWPGLAGLYWIAGSLLYLVGTFLVTIACNVPRNNALAGVEPTGSHGADVWAGYVPGWTAWNHVRTAAALGAAASFSIVLAT
jgi:uncharacterized membrane protein